MIVFSTGEPDDASQFVQALLDAHSGRSEARITAVRQHTFFGGSRLIGPVFNRKSAASRKVILDINRLRPRLTTAEVLDLARFSAATLQKRQNEGRFPKPIERNIYLRDQVLPALGLAAERVTDDELFQEAANAFHRDRSARKR